jgi:hypothetical protein
MSPRRAFRRCTGSVAVAALTLLVGCTATGPGTTVLPSTPVRTAAPTPPAIAQSVSPQASAPRSNTTRPTASRPTTTRPTTTGPTTARSTTTRSTTAPSSTAAAAATRSPNGGTCGTGACYRLGEIHQLPAGVAPEASGIAASATMPGVFFVVDDGTGTDDIAAVRSDGSLVARIGIEGMSARNAEALSAGPCGSRAGRCLYIGDIGDNNAKRTSITVHRLDEPALSPPPAASPADAWRYTYPDGPHNAEAMVVTPDGSLLVLTKSAPDPVSGQVPPHRIYRGRPGGGVLTYLSSYRPPDPGVAMQSLFTGTVVTDASYTAGRMLLLTYDEVVEYRAPKPGADPATFPSWPHTELPAPAMIQSEGITADVTGCGYEVTSEEGPDGSRAGLASVACS